MDVTENYSGSNNNEISGNEIVVERVFPKEKKRYIYTAVKRLFDFVLSFVGLIALSPLLLITAAAIKTDSKGPVLYSQPRAGKNGRVFKMYKFRSMCADADQHLYELQKLNERDGPAFKIANDPRVTRVGRVIRRKSIDELPQLINIIKGDMSIVGPRPPLLNEVSQYTETQMRRLDVKPGLTCYWQISGRDGITFDQWVKLDCKYIEERSLLTDLKIILRTIPTVLFGWGAY